MLLATHSLHFRVHTRVLLTLLVALAAATVIWAEPNHRRLLREAGEAQRAADLPTALAKLERVVELRPDYPRALVGLARLQATSGHSAAALASLQSLAQRGVAYDTGTDAALAPLGALPAFAPLATQFADNRSPRGNAALALTLPAQAGIIESVAIDSHGRTFFGDVRERCIWVRSADGVLRRFSRDEDHLLGVFGLALDETRGALWVGVSAVPETNRFTTRESAHSFLAEYDLLTGALRRTIPVPPGRDAHVFGSLRLSNDGSVFVTDSVAPVIWRLAPGAAQLEAWLEHSDFLSLQGLAFSPDGQLLFVADYANGIWSINVATRQPTLLQPANDTTLFGIDDLHFYHDGLIGIQNGIDPLRIVRVILQPDATARATVLLQGDARLSDPATGTIAHGQLHFVGNSGWSLFDGSITPPAARDVAVLRLQL